MRKVFNKNTIKKTLIIQIRTRSTHSIRIIFNSLFLKKQHQGKYCSLVSFSLWLSSQLQQVSSIALSLSLHFSLLNLSLLQTLSLYYSHFNILYFHHFIFRKYFFFSFFLIKENYKTSCNYVFYLIISIYLSSFLY